jgi:hypothetical protein
MTIGTPRLLDTIYVVEDSQHKRLLCPVLNSPPRNEDYLERIKVTYVSLSFRTFSFNC